MRVVTTSHQQGLEDYGFRWLESRANWPQDTEFVYYTDGFAVDCPSKDFRDLPQFIEWKAKHRRYIAPTWQFDVVKFAHKVFAIADALYDYDGIGVWLDADCVTYKPIPEGMIESQLNGAFVASYARTGMYTETGLWIMDCSHPQKRAFLDFMRNVYLTERYKQLPQWHDCFVFDAAVRAFSELAEFQSLSGEHHRSMHPQALSVLGQYIDHAKGNRKVNGYSPENRSHAEHLASAQ